jgi:TonB family protein
MSVEAHELMSEPWTRWQGHLINGLFSLGRYLGSSDHSGVFLTMSAARYPTDLAIKLVPVNRARAESLLPRWKRAGGLAHPHLMRLLEWGGCQLDGLPFLYLVMEYADQTLAQLLPQRALTEDEAREMLDPILDVLAFLHGRGLVQGQLKPANILVVGDQLKLASDTIRLGTEGVTSTDVASVYDPPEIRYGTRSTAADIWALGISLTEALTRREPTGLGENGNPVVLPGDLSPALRDVVTRCLSRRPENRPSAAQLIAWVQRQSTGSLPAATVQTATLGAPGPSTPGPSTPQASTPQASTPQASTPQASTPERSAPEPSAPERSAPERSAPERSAPERSAPEPSAPELSAPELSAPEPSAPEPSAPAPAPPQVVPQTAAVAEAAPPQVIPQAARFAVMLAVATLALGWVGVRVLRTGRTPGPPAPVQTSGASRSVSASGAAAPNAGHVPAPHSAVSTASPAGRGATTGPLALHEVIPQVPVSARRTIHGHVKVWVRVIIDSDGTVFAAVADRAGPSRYFERLAVEAAKNWTFPPASTASRRLMQVRFDFTRDGTTARAVPLH